MTENNYFHITWVTHNSRISKRMKDYHVKTSEPVHLTEEMRDEISGYINKIANEYDFNISVFKVNLDHVHILLVCPEKERDNIVRILKSKTTYYYKKNHKINETFNLWAQKYNSSIIKTDKELQNVYNYILYNDLKHDSIDHYFVASGTRGLDPLSNTDNKKDINNA